MSRGESFARFNSAARSYLDPDIGPVENEDCSVGACESVAAYRVPWPSIGDVAYCSHHLARYRYHHPDLFERVQAHVEEDLTPLATRGNRWLALEEVPERIRGGRYRRVGVTARGYALFERVEPDEDGLVTYVGGDLSPAEEDVLEVLAQHGESSHQELADESGRSTSTVYRLFRKLADAVVSDDGVFSFASEYLQDEFQNLMGLVEDSVDYAKQSIAELQAQEGVDDLGPLGRWARAHGARIDFDRRNDRFEIDFKVDQMSRLDLERIPRAGVEAARDTGVHTWKRFRDGRFSWVAQDGQRKTNQKPIKNRGAVLRP